MKGGLTRRREEDTKEERENKLGCHQGSLRVLRVFIASSCDTTLQAVFASEQLVLSNITCHLTGRLLL